MYTYSWKIIRRPQNHKTSSKSRFHVTIFGENAAQKRNRGLWLRAQRVAVHRHTGWKLTSYKSNHLAAMPTLICALVQHSARYSSPLPRVSARDGAEKYRRTTARVPRPQSVHLLLPCSPSTTQRLLPAPTQRESCQRHVSSSSTTNSKSFVKGPGSVMELRHCSSPMWGVSLV